MPTLSFVIRGGPLVAPGLDPYRIATVSYTLPDGTALFTGDVYSSSVAHDGNLGWIREYHCKGLRARADYIPMTDEVSLTDTARFNLEDDDPDVILSRQGRTVGQVVLDVLEMATVRAALVAAGIGGYTSAGSGASGTAVMAGGTVSSVTVAAGGTGYTTAPSVRFSGWCTTPAAGYATVSGGAVTAITVTTAGAGYRAAPTVLISTLPPDTLADLDTLNFLPPYEITIAGERLLDAIEGAVKNSHPNHWLHVDPLGHIRFFDPRTYSTTVTLTLGTTRCELPTITRDWSGSYPRVVIRGNTMIQGWTLGEVPAPGSALADDGLAEDFAYGSFTNAQAKAATSPNDFVNPLSTPGQAAGFAVVAGGKVTQVSLMAGGYGYTGTPTVTLSGGGGSGATATATLSSGSVTKFTVTAAGTGYTSAPNVIVSPPAGVGQYDQGTCTCPNTTSVTVTSSNPQAVFAADYWDWSPTGHQGVIVLVSDTLSGVQQKQTARIIAGTAMAAGGTATLTIDTPLPSTAYNAYQIFGLGGGPANVGRKFQATNSYVKGHLRQNFPYPYAYRNAEGTSASLTSTATGTVIHNGVSVPVALTIDSDNGLIYTDQPVQYLFSPDGKTAVWPDDVQVFVPVQVGALTATYPADVGGAAQYGGTSNTVEGLTRTKYITVSAWRDNSNAANMLIYAYEMFGALSNTVVEGSVSYAGLLDSVLSPGTLIAITAAYTTGWETPNPCTAVELEFHETGGTGTSYTTHMRTSNRRAPYSAALFTRPPMSGQGPLAIYGGGLDLTPYAGMLPNVGAIVTNGTGAFSPEVGEGGSSGDIPEHRARRHRQHHAPQGDPSQVTAANFGVGSKESGEVVAPGESHRERELTIPEWVDKDLARQHNEARARQAQRQREEINERNRQRARESEYKHFVGPPEPKQAEPEGPVGG